MKKFSKIIEGKNLGYKDFFGKKVNHREAFVSYLKSSLYEIMMEEKEISEKAFDKVDDVIEMVDSKLSSLDLSKYHKMYDNNKRLKYIAEIIFDKHFK